MSVLSGRGRFLLWIAGTVLLLALGIHLIFFWIGIGRPYDPPKYSFDGSSEDLQNTVIVPTLDTHIPDKKSAVWCSSFQLAWNHLETDVAKGAVQLKNAQTIADRLNRAEQSDNDLDAQDYYAVAGTVRDGIIPKIQAEMARKFPDIPAPVLDVPADGAVAYGYMRAQVKFTIPFFEDDEELPFTDSNGRQVAVKSFGIRKKDDYAYERLREQVHVLYCSEDVFWKQKAGGEFIVDPCKSSDPYQIILASIARKPTLAEAVAFVQQKLAEKPFSPIANLFHVRDSLLIPSMHWRISHRFKELEGKDKQFLNPTLTDLHLDMALQTIEFRLDRSGAELSSESKVYMKPGASFFHYIRPFLIILKKRDAGQPISVMWVDNSELLDK